MFLRNTTDLNYYFRRTNLIEYFDEDNLNKRTKFYIKRVGRKIKDKTLYNNFKYWVLWRWINKNFQFSESFTSQLRKNIRKLDLDLSAKEDNFLYELDELLFNSWRPLKKIPVRFEIEKKEKLSLLQTKVNLHELVLDENGEEKPKMIGTFDAYYSSKKIYFTNSKQVILFKLLYSDINSIEQRRFGTIVRTEKTNYLIRGRNRLLTYVMLQRMNPSLKLDISKIENLYDYFDYFNRIFSKIN
ncbi:hypothetical protein SCHIN_v1c02920 [Spiroplasma chinense]|uniref:Uncharacterized protein n=1 Tax=Spiroplasma chinense TaxID=216932 RepID=A0A5B9Y480_9MOLU|nr:hypothetical protein [Spiroplasma chinense]QEH61489.1 hypothetical protein SCHIN_v1c02920 [Spiroplasma chinense]